MSAGQVIVIVLAAAAVVWAIVWFARGHGPFDEEGVEKPTDRDDDHAAEAGHFGPSDAGAEPQVGPTNRFGDAPPPG